MEILESILYLYTVFATIPIYKGFCSVFIKDSIPIILNLNYLHMFR